MPCTNFGIMNNASLNLAWAIKLIFQNLKVKLTEIVKQVELNFTVSVFDREASIHVCFNQLPITGSQTT